MKKINVIVIDDSALIRQLLSTILSQDSEFGVVEVAPDPVFALRKMEKLWPDVIILDIEMPRMNGIEFTRKIMHERPTPIIILSSKTEKNLSLGFEALNAGAVELLNKPELGLKDFIESAAPLLIQTIKAAATAKIIRRASRPIYSPEEHVRKIKKVGSKSIAKIRGLILIGASTGGTAAIEKIFSSVNFPHYPVIIVQHMPSGFTHAFASRLDKNYSSNYFEAADHNEISDNCVYIAPGGLQTTVVQEDGNLRLRVTDLPPVNRHKPSVDVLFKSGAKIPQIPMLGILLTGMGSDGADGLFEIRKAGGRTIAQDAESCVVFGMPAEAIARGGGRTYSPLVGNLARYQRFL